MSDVLLLLLVVVLLVCLIATVGFFLLHSGLLTEVHIKTGAPPIRNVTIAYKFKEGPYKECGAAFTESSSIGPKLSSIGVFYDDPKQDAFRRTEAFSGRQLEHFWSVNCAERREELMHASCRSSSCWPVTSGWSRATLGPAGPGAAKQPNHCGTGKRRPASSSLLMLANYTYQSSQDAMCNYQLRLSTA